MERDGSLQERLIDVGVELVMAEGASSLGLREIARRAGVSHGAPRRYFPTHHALLSAIARRGVADLQARFTAGIGDATSPRAHLQALARVYVGYALECRGMFELMFRHDLLDSEKHRSHQPRLRESTLPLFELVVGLVARHRAQRDAAHPPGVPGDAEPPPAVTAAVLWANLHGLVQLWAYSSLQFALNASQPGGEQDGDHIDPLISAILDAHLGPANS